MCLPCINRLGKRLDWTHKIVHKVARSSRNGEPSFSQAVSNFPNDTHQLSSSPAARTQHDKPSSEPASVFAVPVASFEEAKQRSGLDMGPATPDHEETPQPQLNGDPEEEKRPQTDAVADNVDALVAHFTSVTSDVQLYRQFLRSRGPYAQNLLDVLQMLLDTPNLDATLRRNLVVAMQRLVVSSGLYPTSYILRDITLTSDYPVDVGSFADIYKGHLSGETVCLKVIRIYQESQGKWAHKRFASEVIIWRQLSHPNLLPSYGIYELNLRLCLVSPWMDNGDMIGYLERHPDTNRPLLASDVAFGLAYLHEHNIVHGDLKGANVLVNDFGRACLADFGVTSLFDSNNLVWTSVSIVGSKGGSLRWQAPELFNFEDDIAHNTKVSDMYAYGMILYEIFSGQVPFYEFKRDATVMWHLERGRLPSRPPPQSLPWTSWGLTENLWTLMESCWKRLPESRPTIHDIISGYQLGTLRDDRPGPLIDPRGTGSTRATFPTAADIAAILDGGTQIPLPPTNAGPDAPAQPTSHVSYEVVGIPTDNDQMNQQSSSSSLQVEKSQADITHPMSSWNREPLDYLRGLVDSLGLILNDVHMNRQLIHFRDSEAQGLLNVFQMLLDSTLLDAEFRRHLLVAAQRLSSSAGLYPKWFRLEGVDFATAEFFIDGGFAEIYKATLQGHSVCLKVMRLRETHQMHTYLKQFSSEAILWGQLFHSNILPIYGLCEHNKRLCFVSPWMKHGDVNGFLRQHPDTNRKLLASDVASGIAYLHNHEIIHGDLKGANILVDDFGRARVADFGLSAISGTNILHWASHSLPASKGGTYRYQAPELLAHEEDEISESIHEEEDGLFELPSHQKTEHVHNTKASDIYAFACILYEIFTGKPPFYQYGGISFIPRVQAGAKPSRPPEKSQAWKRWGLTESLWSLIVIGWSTIPDDRPTIHEILSHVELQALRDDRPIAATEDISSARFRGSIYAQSELPRVSEIESLLDSIRSGSSMVNDIE